MNRPLEETYETRLMASTLYHPAFGQVLKYRLDQVSDNPSEQVAQTINMMAGYVVEDWNSPEIEADARQALEQNPNVSPVEAVFRFVKRRIVFTSDESLAAPLQPFHSRQIVETLIRPRDLSVLCSSGQCQGKATATTSPCTRRPCCTPSAFKMCAS